MTEQDDFTATELTPQLSPAQLRRARDRRSIIIGAGLHMAGEGYDPNSPIAAVIDTYRNWLHFPDPAPVFAALGVAAGHLLPGSPIWLMLVGQASCGKTTVINSLASLPRAVSASTLTTSSLLSGSGKKDRDSNSTGGVMREIGDSGILLLKDFNSILGMDRDERDRTMRALSEIYDGRWDRPVGSDGGRHMSWGPGKMSLLGGCTPNIDDYGNALALMGSRFMYYRFDLVNGYAQANSALDSAGQMAEATDAIQNATVDLFASLEVPKSLQAVKGDSRKRLVSLANFAIFCRTPVQRDPYKHDITGVSKPEAPGRFITAIQQLLQGMRLIGIKEEEAWRVTCRIAMDSMPELRLRIIQALSTHKKDELSYGTIEMAEHLQYPSTPIRRCLEDLEALRMVERTTDGKEHQWKMTSASLYEYRSAFPKVTN